MERIKGLWNKISYEVIIFAILQFQFLTGRALDSGGTGPPHGARWITQWEPDQDF